MEEDDAGRLIHNSNGRDRRVVHSLSMSNSVTTLALDLATLSPTSFRLAARRCVPFSSCLSYSQILREFCTSFTWIVLSGAIQILVQLGWVSQPSPMLCAGSACSLA